ncbi:MAG: hypothetical protein R3C15_00095 [Thermoleophilia bacterium]
MPTREQRRLRRLPARRILVALLILAGTLVALVGSFNVWVERQALDTDDWVRTSGQLLDDDDVRAAVSLAIVDGVFRRIDVPRELLGALPPQAQELAPALATGLRDVAARTATRLLGTPESRLLWRDANRAAHEQFLAVVDDRAVVDPPGGPAVALDLRPLMLQVASELGLARVADRLIGPGDGRITILREHQVEGAQDAVGVIRKASWLLALVTLGLFGGAIALARGHRRQALRACAASLVLVGLALVVVRRIAGNALVESLADDDQAERAASATWFIGTSLLADVALAAIVLGALGLVGAWLLGPTRLATALRAWLAPTLQLRPWRAYAALGLAFGIALAAGPDGGRRLVGTLVAGAIALGVLEALRRRSAREFPGARPDDDLLAGIAWHRTKDVASGLERLAVLHREGDLTDEEWSAAKAELLRRR